MKKYTKFVLAVLVAASLNGCGSTGGELFGIRKPQPAIVWVGIDRGSSSATFHANRKDPRVEIFTVYSIDSHGSKRYLQLDSPVISIQGSNGVVTVVVSHGCEAMNFSSDYYMAVQFETDVWNYDVGGGSTKPATASGLWKFAPDGTITRIS